jgi:hypothetical protein
LQEIVHALRFVTEAERLLGFVEGINDERDAVPLLLEFRKLFGDIDDGDRIHRDDTPPDANDDGELVGLSHIVSVLEHFDPPTRERMLTYLCGRFPCEHAALSTAKGGEI